MAHTGRVVRRLLDFLEYDEVTLFSLNYSCLVAVLLDPGLLLDFLRFLFLSGALVLLPVSLVYTIIVGYGMYYSIKHIWTDVPKTSREMFFMAGGGATLACSTAGFALYSLSGSSFAAKIPALYALLYNLLILWFMGLLPGLDVGKYFIARHEARRSEAVVALLLITVLAAVLKIAFEFPWWLVINSCVFYSLSANKLVILILERLHRNPETTSDS